jgi:hypothetical protein
MTLNSLADMRDPSIIVTIADETSKSKLGVFVRTGAIRNIVAGQNCTIKARVGLDSI